MNSGLEWESKHLPNTAMIISWNDNDVMAMAGGHRHSANIEI